MEPLFSLAIKLPPFGSRRRTRDLHIQLRNAIVDGRLKAGLALPASRELAKACKVSRNAVLAAYDLLQSEGYVIARRGAGTYVADLRSPKRGASTQQVQARRFNSFWSRPQFQSTEPRKHFKYDFSVGVPDMNSFPFAVWRRLTARALRNLEKQTARYGDAQGERELRQSISRHVSFTRAVACGAEHIVVTSGAQQAFDLLARVLVTRKHNVVAVEEPGYPPLHEAFAAAGAKIVHVPVDDEGIMVERLPRNAAVICVTPSHQFPLGRVLTMRRRAELLEFARHHRTVIVEDDYDGEFRFTTQPLDALRTLDRDESVFYVGTFSKSMLPALRMGFIVAPSWAIPPLALVKQTSDRFCGIVEQQALAAFIADGHLLRHVRRMRRIYGERRQRLLAGLSEYFHGDLEVVPAIAGLHVSAFARSSKNLQSLVARARDNDVLVSSLDAYYRHRSPKRGLIFGYGLIETAQITRGLATLHRLWRS